jgi:uncharacterized membrane protein YphA (DoxX/SURF4 family)
MVTTYNINLFDKVDNYFIASLLLVMFVLSGIDKIYNYDKVVVNLQGKISIELPLIFYQLLAIIVIIIEILAPIIIIYYFYSKKYSYYAQYSILILILFTILATLMYHFPDFSSYKKSIPFWANVSLIGGLILLSKNISPHGN